MRQVIILGGGTSVTEGIESGLFERLIGKFSVGLNYSHHFFRSTIVMFVDQEFISGQAFYLRKLPLAIGKGNHHHSQDSIYFLPSANEYRRDCSLGVYKETLVGLYALSLMIHILGEGEIFLLGYDYGAKKNGGQNQQCHHNRRPLTHWYQHSDVKSVYTNEVFKVNHRGIGKINWYESTRLDEKSQRRISNAEHEFQVYTNEKAVNIYNVSMESAITVFPKITYDQFYEKLEDCPFDQGELCSHVIRKVEDIQYRLGRIK